MKTYRPGDPGYDDIIRQLPKPKVVKPKEKNIFSKGLHQFGAGMKENVLGIGQGIADLGVATGTISENDEMASKSKALSEYFARQMQTPDLVEGREVMQGWKNPVQKSLRLLGGAIPSIASGAVGGSIGTNIGKAAIAKGMFKKSLSKYGKKHLLYAPKVAGYLGALTGSIPLGASIAGSYWSEGVAAGKDPMDKGHYAMALTDGVVQSVLESMPIMGWMKGGSLAKRVGKGMFQEGGEEVVQGLFENYMKIKGWKGTENFYKDMVTGIADNFVAGALSGGLLGTVGPVSIEDQKFDLTNKISKQAFEAVNADKVSNPDGTPVSYAQVKAAVGTIVNEVDKLDSIVYDKLIKKLNEQLGIDAKVTASGKHAAMTRARLEDGELVSSEDVNFAREPLFKGGKGAIAERKRRSSIKEIYTKQMDDYFLHGKKLPWKDIPEVVRHNIFNDPDLNSLNLTVEGVRQSLDRELDKDIVYVDGPDGFTNPNATVYYGPLRNLTVDWVSGRKETKTPVKKGDIWIRELGRKVLEMGKDPRSIQFVGKGADKALQTFISETNLLLPKGQKIQIKKRAKTKASMDTKLNKLVKEAGDKTEEFALEQQRAINDEKEIAYGDQQTYTRTLHEAIRNAWETLQSATNGNAVMEATQLFRYVMKGQKIGILRDGKPWLKVSGPQDIAEIFSFFRNPTLEISQAVYVKDGLVLEHEALSLGNPGETTIPLNLISEKAKKLGAKYYVLHNHPSGNVDASNEDLANVSKAQADEQFAGHIILNHNKFNFIESTGKQSTLDYLSPKQFFHKGKKTIEQEIITNAAKGFKDGELTIFLTDGEHLVNIVYVNPKEENVAAAIGEAMVRNLAPNYFIGANDKNLIPQELPEGIVKNGAVIKKGNNLEEFIDLEGTIPVWDKKQVRKYVSKLTGIKSISKGKYKGAFKLKASYESRILQALALQEKDQKRLEALQERIGTLETRKPIGSTTKYLDIEGLNAGQIPVTAEQQEYEGLHPDAYKAAGKGKSAFYGVPQRFWNRKAGDPELVEQPKEEESRKVQPIRNRPYGTEARPLPQEFMYEKIEEDNVPKELKPLYVTNLLDMLNNVWEMGIVGQKQADKIYNKINDILTKQVSRIGLEASKRGAALFKKDAMTMDSIRSYLWNLNLEPDIEMRQILGSDVKGHAEKRYDIGFKLNEELHETRFPAYRLFRNLISYYTRITGYDLKTINEKVDKAVQKAFKVSGKDLSTKKGKGLDPVDQLESLQKLVLLARGQTEPMSKAMEKKFLKQGKELRVDTGAATGLFRKTKMVEFAEETLSGGKKAYISTEGYGPNPWYLATGKTANGTFIGIVPQIKEMIAKLETKLGRKLEDGTNPRMENGKVVKEKVMKNGNVVEVTEFIPAHPYVEKLKELEATAKWLESGIGDVYEEFVKERQNVKEEKLNGVWNEELGMFEGGVEGVYFHTSHIKMGLGTSKPVFLPEGAYRIIRDPATTKPLPGWNEMSPSKKNFEKNRVDRGSIKLTRDPEATWDNATLPNGDPSPVMSTYNDLEKESVTKTLPDGKSKTSTISFAKSLSFYSASEIDDIIKNDIIPGAYRVEETKKEVRAREKAERERAEKLEATKNKFSVLKKQSWDEFLATEEGKAWKAEDDKKRKEDAAAARKADEDWRAYVKSLGLSVDDKGQLDYSSIQYDEDGVEVEPTDRIQSTVVQEIEEHDSLDDVSASVSFDGKKLTDTLSYNEATKYESEKFRKAKKFFGFFIGDEKNTIKFLEDWIVGGQNTLLKWQKEVPDAPKEVMDQVIKTAVADKNYIKLAQLKGFQIQDIIKQSILDEMKVMYPNLSVEEQRQKGAEWAKYMQDAGEEIVLVPGVNTHFTYSDKGVGGPWEIGVDGVDDEMIANVERLAEMYRLKHGKLPSPQLVGRWKKSRPALAYYNILPKGLQKVIIWNKANVEDTIFFAAAPSVLSRTDNINNRQAGYSPRMFVEDLALENKSSSGRVPQAVKSQRVQQKKYNTFAEYAKFTQGGLEAVDNYAASAGWYTKEYLIRINQNAVIEQFKTIRNPGEHDIAMITYTTDVEAKAKSLGYTGNNAGAAFLSDQGYLQMDNAEGLTKHWRGEFFPPWVHKSIHAAIDRFYIQPGEASNSRLAGINQFNGWAKRMIMALPHQFALNMSSSSWLWQKSLKDAWKYGIEPAFNPLSIAKGMKLARERADKPFAKLEDDYDHAKLDLFMKHGLRAMSGSWIREGLFDKRAFGKHPADRNKSERFWDMLEDKGGLNSYVFDQYISKSVFRYAEAMYDRFQKKHPNKSKDELAQLAVKFVNDTSGTLPSYIYGTEGPALQFFLFARDFTMNFARQLTGAMYQIPGFKTAYKLRAKKRVLNPLLHAESTTAEMEFLSPWYTEHLLRTMFAKVLVFGAIQFAAWHMRPEDEREEKDKWIWFNEQGKKASIKLPGIGPDDHDYYLDPIIWRELTQFMNLLPEQAGIGSGPVNMALGKMSYTLKMVADTVTNENYMGDPIRDPGKNPIGPENLARQMGYYFSQVLPGPIKEQPKELNEVQWKVLKAMGIPGKRALFPRDTDIKEMKDLRKRQASQMFRRGKKRTSVVMASMEQLMDMVASGKITSQQFTNEVNKRRDPYSSFMKNNYRGLLKDEIMNEVY